MNVIRWTLRTFSARLGAVASIGRTGAAGSFFALLGGLSVQGCGEYVNLGGGVEQWFEGDAVDGGGVGAPIAIYEGTKYPVTYAVDDATLYTAFQIGDPGPRVATLKSCALAAC